MRTNKVKVIAGLKPKVEKIYPNCEFFSQSTTDNGEKGRYNGFVLDNGIRVGVFRKSNSNICKIVTKGDVTNNQEKVDQVVNILNAEGFPLF
jgi:hypothetical protein